MAMETPVARQGGPLQPPPPSLATATEPPAISSKAPGFAGQALKMEIQWWINGTSSIWFGIILEFSFNNSCCWDLMILIEPLKSWSIEVLMEIWWDFYIIGIFIGTISIWLGTSERVWTLMGSLNSPKTIHKNTDVRYTEVLLCSW